MMSNTPEAFEVVRRRYVFRDPDGSLYEVVVFNSREGQVFARIEGNARVSIVGWLSSQAKTSLRLFEETFPKDTLVARV